MNQRPSYTFQAQIRPSVLTVVREAQRQSNMVFNSGGSPFPASRPISHSPPPVRGTTQEETLLQEVGTVETATVPSPALPMVACSLGAITTPVEVAPAGAITPPTVVTPQMEIAPPAAIQTKPIEMTTTGKRADDGHALIPRRYPLRVRKPPERLRL
ncbi:uncharacterized protein O3C94_013607 [Discoglossus pictus]